MANRRSILGVWVIERGSGRNLVARTYTDVDIDVDLIAPFLSATHTFIDQASNEALKTIDTERSRYVWTANESLLFVMVVSKSARIGHMRFMLNYAMEEFMRTQIPENTNATEYLRHWTGAPGSFERFGSFIDELVSQYELTDESLLSSKVMDCLEVYSHLIRGLMRADMDERTREKILGDIKSEIGDLTDRYPVLSSVLVDDRGVDILAINAEDLQDDTSYKTFRVAIEELFGVIARAVRRHMSETTYRDAIFHEVMPYVKRDTDRLQTYAILDDVVRHLF